MEVDYPQPKYLLVVIPASRDTINLKENYPQSWTHQALLPMFTNTVIYEIVYRLKLSFERVMLDYRNLNLNLKMHVLLLTDDITKKPFENEIKTGELESTYFSVEVIGKRFYPNMDLMDVIRDGVKSCKVSRTKGNEEIIGDNIVGILIHFWEVILGFEFYEEMLRRFIEKIKESYEEEYSQILVYVSKFSNKIKVTQNKVDSSEILKKGMPLLRNFLPRSTSIFSYFVYQSDDPRYKYSNPDPRRDRVGIIIKKDNGEEEKYGGLLVPIFLFDRDFYIDIMEYSNVNLTSSFRFVDVLRYMFIDKNQPDILFLKRGRFLFVKYPWDYIKAFDYINREYTLMKLKHTLLAGESSGKFLENSEGMSKTGTYSDEFLRYICENRLKDVPFVAITSRGEVLPFEDILKRNIESLTRLLYNWYQSEEYDLFMGYTFEAYPSKSGADLIVEVFKELGISSLLILSSKHIVDRNLVQDILKNVGITQDTIHHVIFRGINVISIKTRDDIKALMSGESRNKGKLDWDSFKNLVKISISGGVTVANSYIGAGSVIMEGSLITHTILGDFVVVYPQAVIPYSIIGKHTVIGSHVVIARERPRAISMTMEKDEPKIDLETRKHKFLAGRVFVSYVDRFGALVGEHCKIMIGVRINPGRRIGHHSRIRPGVAVYYNVPPYNELVDEETFRPVEGGK